AKPPPPTPADRKAAHRQRLRSSAFTLVVWLDESSCPLLRHAWPTWMRLRPALRGAAKLIVHDDAFDVGRPDVDFLLKSPKTRLAPWKVDATRLRAQSMIEGLLTVAAEQ